MVRFIQSELEVEFDNTITKSGLEGLLIQRKRYLDIFHNEILGLSFYVDGAKAIVKTKSTDIEKVTAWITDNNYNLNVGSFSIEEVICLLENKGENLKRVSNGIVENNRKLFKALKESTLYNNQLEITINDGSVNELGMVRIKEIDFVKQQYYIKKLHISDFANGMLEQLNKGEMNRVKSVEHKEEEVILRHIKMFSEVFKLTGEALKEKTIVACQRCGISKDIIENYI